jgi:GntR family transcriptional regulator, frlABCD operon transcriptional regulator
MLLQESSRPLYEQLKQMIVSDIVSGKYKHGERLPSELALAERYGISRITVRRALSELASDGYLSSQQGRGTFVNYLAGENRLVSFGSFSDGSSEGSPQKSSRVLAKENVRAEGSIASNLQVPEGTPLLRLHRLMSENGRPYSIDTAYFVESRFPDLYGLVKDGVSTFALMKSRYGVAFAKAVKTLGVIRAGVEESRLLECVPGDPLFSISKVIYDEGGTAFHYSHYLIHGDRCVYTLVVTSEVMDMQIHYLDESARLV